MHTYHGLDIIAQVADHRTFVGYFIGLDMCKLDYDGIEQEEQEHHHELVTCGQLNSQVWQA